MMQYGAISVVVSFLNLRKREVFREQSMLLVMLSINRPNKGVLFQYYIAATFTKFPAFYRQGYPAKNLELVKLDESDIIFILIKDTLHLSGLMTQILTKDPIGFGNLTPLQTIVRICITKSTLYILYQVLLHTHISFPI